MHLNLSEIDQSKLPFGGRIANFLGNWEKITSDNTILSHVKGLKIDFQEVPFQGVNAGQMNLSEKEKAALNQEIKEMIEKKAVEIVDQKSLKMNDQFLSTLFVRPKKDGGLRPIFNLKALNRFVAYKHFKMEGFQVVKSTLKQNDFLCKIDLKDAYFCVPIDQSQRKFLRFIWEGETLQYRSLPFGLACGPLIFTKIMKPLVAILRRIGVRLVIYLDDILLLNQSREGLIRDRDSLIYLLHNLGWVINQS